MVTNIYEDRLILFLIEGLVEPLKGLVKAYRTSTFLDAMNRERDLQDSIPSIRVTPKDMVPTNFKN